MNVTCNQCNSKFRLDDTKLPQGQRFSIDCPKCKNKIAVDTREISPPPNPVTQDAISSPGSARDNSEKTLMDEVVEGGYDASEKPFDFVEEGVETALLCEPDEARRSKIDQILNNMGYQTRVPESAIAALKQMRFHVFDIIVLNEQFDTDDPDDCHVLKYLDHLSIDIRRNIFVALLTDRFRTMDNMVAFHKSVNLIVNLNNIDEFEKILYRGIADNTGFYRVFKESLLKAGRI
jgi:predicted Zn finger-like uncharacterized protein